MSSDGKASRGALYIITQDSRYMELLRGSARSLKRAMPDLPITAFSEFPLEDSCFERVVPVQKTQHGFYDKVRLMSESPYERTLFIDADTYVVEPVPELFSLLDQFDCAATHEEYLNTDWFNRCPRPDIPASFPEFNTGILVFKRGERMARLFQDWGSLYQAHLRENPDHPVNDQPFFRTAVYYSETRIATLTREYNCKFRGQGYLNGPVKILHGHVDLKLSQTQVDQAVAVLNASTKPRIYIAGKVYEQKLVGRLVSRRKEHKVGSFPELPGSLMVRRAQRLTQIVRERGIKKTLAKVFSAG